MDETGWGKRDVPCPGHSGFGKGGFVLEAFPEARIGMNFRNLLQSLPLK